MDIKGLGNSGSLNSPFSSANVNTKSKSNGMQESKGVKSAISNINSNYKFEDKLYSTINELQELKTKLMELQSTDILSKENALLPYKITSSSSELESNFNFYNNDDIKTGTYSIKVESISTSYLLSSDDILSDQELGLKGKIEINGIDISIETEDTLSDIKNKLNYGEDLNTNLLLDEGEDVDQNGKLLSEKDIDVRSFQESGKLYIETKSKGSESGISFEGSSSEILQTLGFINENQDIKNLISQGTDGLISINGEEYSGKDDINFDGINFSLKNLYQGQEIDLKVEYNEEKVIATIREFTEKYNEVMEYINNELDTNDREIMAIKENLSIQGESSLGINIKPNNFYQSIFDLRASLGDPLASSLKNSGIIKDESGKIELDIETLSKNLEEVTEFLNNGIIEGLNNSLETYLKDVSIISVKQEASVKTLSEINSSFKSERVINQIVIGNQESMNFLKETLDLFNINSALDTLQSGLNSNINNNEEDNTGFSLSKNEKDNNFGINNNLDFLG